MKTLLSRSKTFLSGDNGNVIMPKESEEPFWLELVRLPTGSCLECQNQNIKAWHHTLRVYLRNGRRTRWCQRIATVTAEISDYGVKLRTVQNLFFEQLLRNFMQQTKISL